MLEAITWWLTLQVLGLAAVPVCAVVFRSLPGSGYAMSKALGLLLVGWLAYTLAMAGLPFGRPLLGGCLVLLLAFDLWLLFRRGGQFFAALRTRFSDPAFRRYVATVEILFVSAFAIWSVVRACAPDIWGTEKFMDYGFLSSVLRSGSFPPKDMWLAGFGINYYYFGYVLMGALTGLSGVTPAVAFPLANVALFALTALGAFGFTLDLISGDLQRRPHKQADSSNHQSDALPVRGRAPAATASAGSGGVAIPLAQHARADLTLDKEHGPLLEFATVALEPAGRADEPSRQLNDPGSDLLAKYGRDLPSNDFDDRSVLATEHVPGIMSPYIFAILAALMVVAMGNLTTLFARKSPDFQSGGNGWQLCFMCQTTDNFDWWAPSRIIRDFRTTAGTGGSPRQVLSTNQTINEFPAFSLFLADLHPHVMALPFALLALSAAYALACRKLHQGDSLFGSSRTKVPGWLTLIVVGIILGSLYATNTWDYPTYLLISLAGLAVSHFASSRTRNTLPPSGRWRGAWAVDAGIVIAASIVAFLPFHLTFRSLVGGQAVPVPDSLKGNIGGIIVEKLDSVLLFNTSDKTIVGFLVIFGIFLVAVVGWLMYSLAGQIGRSHIDDGPASRQQTRLVKVVAGMTALSILVGLALRFPLFAILVPLITVALALVFCEPRRVERNLALLMFAITGAIALVIEVVFLRDVFSDRMNTLFKFYFQIWLIWSLVSAYAVWQMLYSAFGPGQLALVSGKTGAPPDTVHNRTRARVFTGGVGALFLLLALSGMTYLVYAQGRQLHDRMQDPNFQLALDGTRYLQFSSPGDLEAIKWLSSAAGPADVVLECCRDEYITHAGRISAFTGIPTLLAWDGHEKQWRGEQPDWADEIASRRAVVDAIYQGVDPASGAARSLTGAKLLDLLRRYHVTYVVDGETEKGLAGAAGQFPEERVTPYAEALFQQTLGVAFKSSNGQTTLYRVGR